MKVYVVDDEPLVRGALQLQLEAAGHEVIAFSSAPDFLHVAPSLPSGCVLLDIRMPGVDGLAVQRSLAERGLPLAVVVITGHGDVAMAVQAMKDGAVDFIEKPFSAAQITEALQAAAARLAAGPQTHFDANRGDGRLADLTRREWEVLDALVEGLLNKQIAHRLGISSRTVELHRARVMAKAQARSLSELIRLALAGSRSPPARPPD